MFNGLVGIFGFKKWIRANLKLVSPLNKCFRQKWISLRNFGPFWRFWQAQLFFKQKAFTLNWFGPFKIFSKPIGWFLESLNWIWASRNTNGPKGLKLGPMVFPSFCFILVGLDYMPWPMKQILEIFLHKNSLWPNCL